MIGHFCRTCGNEVEESCAAHPEAGVESVRVQPPLDDKRYIFLCDRCGDTAQGDPAELVDATYLVDDPWTATSNLCPACAQEDDAMHVPGSWLLGWSA